MISHYRSDAGALNCPLLCRITGPLETSRLRRALDELTVRHESLRTTFAGRGARLTQRIGPPERVVVERADITPDRLAAAVADELATAIDTRTWPMRVRLWQVLADGRQPEHVLCLNLHHLVTDAWSTGVLLQDLCALYEGTRLPPPGWQYARFSQGQQSMLGSGRLDRQREYWSRQLAGGRLPDLPRRATGSGLADTGRQRRDSGPEPARADAEGAVLERLRDLARQRHTTLFTTLLAVFYAQLHGVTGQQDLTVASMFANRSRPEVRRTVGLLANMVLLRTRLRPEMSFADLVSGTHATVIGAVAHQELPFQMLPSDLLDLGGGRADDVVFNVMADLPHIVTGDAVRFELLVPKEIGRRFPFELAMVPIGQHELRSVLFHAGDRYDQEGAAEFLARYLRLAGELSHAPEAPIGAVIDAVLNNRTGGP